ncbi:MAG: osmoprotectant transport system ATP-binding protein [Frankiaceae bacterium]|nr:osmoprotectant transport system ATP-binding protein [Frankiaceae bacterium]MDQ1633362.1 osmoprotectant transport system ATP-binding protein [Frankiaceae bacterium]MDQ1649667.1 osmoprotectant transport system ATP-binding protein [Frankiaceae bacterium]MDQ1672316.1 osmoprotectant transport system ATP-binding protein [Frankiaceae bacterium]MEA2577464.1 osmoprotectant transport system ATP-binding protein [Chloroflexota bacterium]
MSETVASTRSAETDSGPVSGAEVILENVGKRYPGQQQPAVGDLSMTINAGEIVMLVGPSGCGKTTTLKMINRLIEPTSGRIMLGGEDIIKANGDELRRRIGYVIQAGGLFPHMTVEANVKLVPNMLGWDKKKTATRTEELLDLVGLDPKVYRSRYPKELSGGQQQRVGVARALAADPPVLLMDEPFGAVDPITRQRLQDELLRIQKELRKTIIIVTHDFDEAVKLGDRIAIFRQGGEIVQYDTPEEILASPADDFVESFVGAGATLRQLTLVRVKDVPLDMPVTARIGEDKQEIARRAMQEGARDVVVVDERNRPLRWVDLRELEGSGKLAAGEDNKLKVIGEGATLNDALDTMLVSSHSSAIVVGRGNQIVGRVNVDIITNAIALLRSARNGANDDLDEMPDHDSSTRPSGARRVTR